MDIRKGWGIIPRMQPPGSRVDSKVRETASLGNSESSFKKTEQVNARASQRELYSGRS